MNDYLDDGAQTSDAELLSNFRSTRDETAFRILVKRHAGMVRATALRITGLAVVADEIAQSVFILLARKAPSLQAADTLGPWLHRVAVLQATASVRKENRRRVLLHVWAAGQTIDESASDPAWQEALPALDEASMPCRSRNNGWS
jgi:DNA-directed RNA polymerase specialized sigma24 family protein